MNLHSFVEEQKVIVENSEGRKLYEGSAGDLAILLNKYTEVQKGKCVPAKDGTILIHI